MRTFSTSYGGPPEGMSTRCAARRSPDGDMHCPVCRLTWASDDPEPPACGRTMQVAELPREFVSGLPR